MSPSLPIGLGDFSIRFYCPDTNELLAVATVVGIAAGATILEDILTAGAGTADDLLSVLGALGTAAKFVFA